MTARLDFRKGVAAFGLIVAAFLIAAHGYMLFEDMFSLLTIGAPHIDSPGGGGQSSWLSSMDIQTNGWFTIAYAGFVTAYAVLLFRKYLHLWSRPECVISASNRVIQFNKGLCSRGNANLSDVVSVKLSFDPNNPKSRQNDWFWGDGKERLSISLSKHNGRRKTVSLAAWNIRGGCDALATFVEQLQIEIETSAHSNTKSAKRA
jgi:hypothetical protein